jgi:hypothetical protein
MQKNIIYSIMKIFETEVSTGNAGGKAGISSIPFGRGFYQSGNNGAAGIEFTPSGEPSFKTYKSMKHSKKKLKNKMKNFDEFINENMGYTDFFGKKISHESALEKRTRDLITNIITEELGISEKSFTQLDKVMKIVKDICNNNPKIYEEANEFYNSGKRLNYLAEKGYEEYFKTKINDI